MSHPLSTLGRNKRCGSGEQGAELCLASWCGHVVFALDADYAVLGGVGQCHREIGCRNVATTFFLSESADSGKC